MDALKKGMMRLRGGASKKRKTNPSSSTQQTPDRENEQTIEPQLNFPSADKKAYFELSTRKMFPTLFYDQNACQDLGIDVGVRKILETLGWLEFLKIAQPTYERTTLEFLSTLQWTKISNDEEYPEYEIKFRLFNKQTCLTLTRLNEILKWPKLNTVFDIHNDIYPGHNQLSWWKGITGLPSLD